MPIKKIINILFSSTLQYNPTLIEEIIKLYDKDPFIILICCLLSLRAKDITTIHICKQLLKIAKTPKQIAAIPKNELAKIIFKSGFYRNKAKVLHEVSVKLIEKYNQKVPNTKSELLSLPGVGPKTANLVLSSAYDIPEICVDTHVHRISNRLGIIKTKTVLETEIELQKILQKKYWSIWNNLLVKWGQNICTPTSPWCSKCAINSLCKKVGVKKSR